MAVFTLPEPAVAATDGVIPYVPTWGWWFSFLAEAGGFNDFSLTVQKEIILAYSQMGYDGTSSVLDVFQQLTGCSAKTLRENGSLEGCSTSAMKVNDALTEYYLQGTPCVKVFVDGQGPDTWSVSNSGDVRMMLLQCFDVNPFNTGVGLGWNSYPNPLVCKPPDQQTNDDHYTGKEYVITNPTLEFLSSKAVPYPLETLKLVAASKESNECVAEKGFCDESCNNL